MIYTKPEKVVSFPKFFFIFRNKRRHIALCLGELARNPVPMTLLARLGVATHRLRTASLWGSSKAIGRAS
jgi:hypothetical protein